MYDVLRISNEQQAKWIAVIDRNQLFLGVVSVVEARTFYTQSYSIQSQGAVLVVSLEMKDFQLSEIARLVESENAKVISCLVHNDPSNPQQVEITLKLDIPDSRHVKATLIRFGYRVHDFGQEKGGLNTDEERIGNLLRFLAI